MSIKTMAGATAAMVVALAGLTACTGVEPEPHTPDIDDVLTVIDDLTAGGAPQAVTILDQYEPGTALLYLDGVDRSHINVESFRNDEGESCWTIEFQGPDGALPETAKLESVSTRGLDGTLHASWNCTSNHEHFNTVFMQMVDDLEEATSVDVALRIEPERLAVTSDD